MSHDFPVIDIAAVRQPQVSAAARFEIARQVASACEEIGFFAVTGHGAPGAVIADWLPSPMLSSICRLPRSSQCGDRGPSRTAAISRRARNVWLDCEATKHRRI
jgi:non-heme dioxygenase-like protein